MAGNVVIGHTIAMSSKNSGPDDDLPNRIRELREAEGLSMAALAARLGENVEASTVNKLEKGTVNLTTRWMKRLGEALAVDPIEILVAQPRLRRVKVIGAVQAGNWVEALQWTDPDDIYEVAVPDAPELADVQIDGYEVRGPSMNKVYPDGSVIVVASIFSTREQLMSGKRYVFEMIRPSGEREGTVKTFEIDAAGRKWLVPETDDRSFQPISLEDGAFDDDVLIQALGRVVWSVRPE